MAVSVRPAMRPMTARSVNKGDVALRLRSGTSFGVSGEWH
jgi:hypothetical protein